MTASSSEATPFDMTMYESSFNALEVLDGSDITMQNDVSPGSYPTFSIEQFAGLDFQNWDFTWAVFDEHTLAASLYHRPTDIDVDVLIRFPFLDNFTTSTGFAKSFKCGISEQSMSQSLEFYNSRATRRLLSPESLCDGPESHRIESTAALVPAVYNETDLDQRIDHLLPKTHEIVALIRQATLNKPQRSIITTLWSTSLEARCYEFFHAINMEKYLALFWSCWNPNWPTIHRPTFIVSDKSPSLIAAMVIVGAYLSPEQQDRGMAQVWLNVVEEIVFSDALFSHSNPSEAWSKSGQMALRQAQLDILQAAYCVCLYQTWEGSKQSKKRVLRHRYNELVFLARDIGLGNATLESVNTSRLADFDWQEFIARESLIRMFTYICNLDSGFAQFFRFPPRLMLSQMTVELTSAEVCFQATSMEDCFVALRTWRCAMGSALHKYTINTVVEALYDPRTRTSSALQQAFSQMSVLNMFTIISAIYSQIFTLELALMPTALPSAILPLETALQQWKELWPSANRDAELADMALQQSGADDWRRVGFIRHAPEYWLLAHLIVQRIRKGERVNQSTPWVAKVELSKTVLPMQCDDDDMTEAHALISDFQRLSPR